MITDIIGLFLFIAGFVIGLGAATVIDIHGFLGRKSSYWTEATTRTHKVTKPLIWLGMFLAIIWGTIFYRNEGLSQIPQIQLILAAVLILNGIFLSFRVSQFLLAKEKEGRAGELISSAWQKKITVSFIVSIVGWWVSLLLLIIYLVG